MGDRDDLKILGWGMGAVERERAAEPLCATYTIHLVTNYNLSSSSLFLKWTLSGRSQQNFQSYAMEMGILLLSTYITKMIRR